MVPQKFQEVRRIEEAVDFPRVVSRVRKVWSPMRDFHHPPHRLVVCMKRKLRPQTYKMLTTCAVPEDYLRLEILKDA